MKSSTIIIAHKDKLRQASIATTMSILDCEVIKTLSTGVRTLRYIVREKPDIAILQSCLGDVSAFEIVKEIASKNIKTKCILIFDEPSYENLLMARSLNIHGCFCENGTAMQMLSSLHAVLGGEKGICEKILDTESDKNNLNNIEMLSDKEIQIMTLFGFYKNKRKVAQKLEFSNKKIERIQKGIASKLNIESSESCLANWAEQNRDLIKTLAL
ncbi:hypothetical protein ULMS_01580 [Patiriisocius marinistellae]|uniref:Response regulatory domain-containing protein n=1 Tax=Patiriisocius marinistellae TaxID=2494560 RepID=A0A5J4FT29_9FLAO|nr:response regulator transcription factor [Patiriisocius marinistellae]GEQ84650.1 hypothetical protein ULMS_01580 [Patiriisocius marinistellae]